MKSTPIVFLPGMMLDEPSYAHQLETLDAHHPASVANLAQAATISQLARDVLSAAPPRFALVGSSMGGIVAFEIWRQAAQRVTHMALLDTTPYAERSERSRWRQEQIDHVEAGGLREVIMSLTPQYLAARNRENASLDRAILGMGLRLGATAFRRQSLALRDRPDSVPTLGTITCPTLVLCGREDRLCPMEWHVTMANAIARADLTVLAECGHLSTLEEPQVVTSALQRLLSRSS